MRESLNLKGKKFGELTADYSGMVKGIRGWYCSCSCGNKIFVSTSQLNGGIKKSCGCLSQRRLFKHKGKRFGNLVAIDLAGYTPSNRPLWNCLCDCGNEVVTQSRYLTRGTKTDCGCKTHEKRSSASRLEFGESTRNKILGNYKGNARNKGLAFTLSDDEVFELFQSNCHYCNEKPCKTINLEGHYGEYTYNGIDRKDSTEGYTKENTVGCCEKCNYLKGNIPYDAFLNMIKRIYENRCLYE